jgi:hypothetical protein
VRFRIREFARRQVQGGEEVTWLATHESKTGTARFRISLTLEALASDAPVGFTKCSFVREPDSHGTEFLRQLGKCSGGQETDRQEGACRSSGFRRCSPGYWSRSRTERRFFGRTEWRLDRDQGLYRERRGRVLSRP